ncbi:hypothetical protein E2C01_035216 [Portunus trituberculatus]|uniref:Uncharacterized protein n=1 Tax=Portunus trituberculatus TaxID=210409 RepID=A0A5B7F8M0_PORTR|nr:hypothetical protein [Portunus trituberculatus]
MDPATLGFYRLVVNQVDRGTGGVVEAAAAISLEGALSMVRRDGAMVQGRHPLSVPRCTDSVKRPYSETLCSHATTIFRDHRDDLPGS